MGEAPDGKKVETASQKPRRPHFRIRRFYQSAEVAAAPHQHQLVCLRHSVRVGWSPLKEEALIRKFLKLAGNGTLFGDETQSGPPDPDSSVHFEVSIIEAERAASFVFGQMDGTVPDEPNLGISFFDRAGAPPPGTSDWK